MQSHCNLSASSVQHQCSALSRRLELRSLVEQFRVGQRSAALHLEITDSAVGPELRALAKRFRAGQRNAAPRAMSICCAAQCSDGRVATLSLNRLIHVGRSSVRLVEAFTEKGLPKWSLPECQLSPPAGARHVLKHCPIRQISSIMHHRELNNKQIEINIFLHFY